MFEFIKNIIVKYKRSKIKEKIVGATIGWSGKVQLCFENGKIFANPKVDRLVYPEYFPNNNEWPINPVTGEKLPERIKGCLM